jgi:hypothetical protein
MKYIVVLEVDDSGGALQFIAPWSGDPGRTCIIENARRYKSAYCATLGLAHARKYHDFNNAIIRSVDE